MRLALESSRLIEGVSGEMVLRDEKERIRLTRLSRSIRKETKCCIYRSKLQTYEGEPEIDDVDVYLGLTSCRRVEACGICLDSECLDRFEEYLTRFFIFLSNWNSLYFFSSCWRLGVFSK